MSVNRQIRGPTPGLRAGLSSQNVSPSSSKPRCDDVARHTDLSGVIRPPDKAYVSPSRSALRRDGFAGHTDLSAGIRPPNLDKLRIPGGITRSSLSLDGDSTSSVFTGASSQSELSGSKEPPSESRRAPESTQWLRSDRATRIRQESDLNEIYSGAAGSKEASRSEESSGPKNAPRSGKAATSRQGSGSEMPSEFNGENGANMPLRLKDAPGPGKPSNVDITNPGTNYDSKAGPCWTEATLLLKKEHPNEFKVLFSSTEEKSLTEVEVLGRLGSTSKEQVKSQKTHVYVERVWQALEPFNQLGMTAARANPSGIACYAVASLFLLVKLVRGLEYRELILEAFSDITCMIMRWCHFEKRLFNPRDPFLIDIKDEVKALKGHLRSLFFIGLKLLATIYSYLDDNRAQRLAHRLTAEKVGWQSELKGLRKIEAEYRTSKEKIDREVKLHKKNTSILTWITNTNQKRDHELLQCFLGIDEAYKDCGKWLFITPEYHNWKQVGTGKTTLMYRAIKDLHEDFKYGGHGEHPVIHYYFTDSKPDETQSDCKQCLRALIRQLARKTNSLTIEPSVQNVYDKHKLDNKVNYRFSTKECKKLLKKLIPSDPKKLRITIMIDALDEYEDSGYELLGVLSSLLKSRPLSIRLLLSSQLHIEVEQHFSERFPNDNILQSIQINRNRTQDDMHIFIEKEMGKRAEMPGNHFWNSRKDLYAEVAKELKTRSNGMFQWVKLRIGIFFPMPALEAVKVRKELDELQKASSKDLNPAYRRLYANNVIQGYRQDTAKIYRLILSAYKPLTLKQVIEAVSIENDGKINHEINEEYIRRRCHNFVIENEAGYLQFAHHSARLFLKRVGNPGDKDFAEVDDFSDPTNHREMAKICLQLMLKSNHRMRSEARLHRLDSDGYQALASFHPWEKQPRFGQYAFRYWAQHCSHLGSSLKLGSKLSEDLTTVISEPKTAFPSWCRLASGRSNQVRRCKSTASSSSKSLDFPTHPLLTACAWDFAECLDQPRIRKEWPSEDSSPVHVCCEFGSNQALLKLIQYYQEKVWTQMFLETHILFNKTPIQMAVGRSDVNITKSLLEFEKSRATNRSRAIKRSRATAQSRATPQPIHWSSIQLLFLSPLGRKMKMGAYNRKAVSMLELLLKYEADQTGACFSQHSEDRWVSELAQGTDKDRPLKTAVGESTPEFVRMLLQAGAKLTAGISNRAGRTILEKAFNRTDKHGPEVVKLLLSLLPKNPADWNKFASNEDFVYYLGSRATVETATHILQKRPELVQRWECHGEKAIKIASRNRDREQYLEYGLTSWHYQQLIDVMLKFGAQLADAQDTTEEKIEREKLERRLMEN